MMNDLEIQRLVSGVTIVNPDGVRYEVYLRKEEYLVIKTERQISNAEGWFYKGSRSRVESIHLLKEGDLIYSVVDGGGDWEHPFQVVLASSDVGKLAEVILAQYLGVLAEGLYDWDIVTEESFACC